MARMFRRKRTRDRRNLLLVLEDLSRNLRELHQISEDSEGSPLEGEGRSESKIITDMGEGKGDLSEDVGKGEGDG